MVMMETELVKWGRVSRNHCGTGDWHGRRGAPLNHQNTVIHRDIDW